ncbi:hypothetical protein P3S67_001258 [Capsicum chacoense]
MNINVEVMEMWSVDVAVKPCYVVAPSKYLPTQHSNPLTDEEIVGFGSDTEKLVQYIKMTIARKVYNSDMIVFRFDVRAWCIISQSYKLRELLQQIFSQVTGSKDNGDKDDILADKLRKSLMGKRYLIVLDDMWDGMAWDDLCLCFPDFGNRSRIVKKVFQKEDCPPELQDVCLAVAVKCKGLCLVIFLVAGIIKRKKMESSWWHEVKDALFDCLDRESGEYSLSTMQLNS